MPSSMERVASDFGFEVGENSLENLDKELGGNVRKGEILFKKID
jgi:hypothetical protein